MTQTTPISAEAINRQIQATACKGCIYIQHVMKYVFPDMKQIHALFRNVFFPMCLRDPLVLILCAKKSLASLPIWIRRDTNVTSAARENGTARSANTGRCC